MKFLNSFQIFLGIFLILIIGVLSVEITNFRVPDHIVIDDPTPEDLVLDCEYRLQPGETNLVVKWLKDSEIIYQWIQGRPPKSFPNVRMEINESYVVSDDENQKYRALVIQNPTWNATGKYRCLVQTRQSADKMEGHLQVIDISNITFTVEDDIDEDDLQVKCTIENIYPQPKLRIKNDDENVHIKSEIFGRRSNGYYNVTALGILKHTEKGEKLSCTLLVPGTNFTYSTATDSGSTLRLSIMVMLISFIVTMFCT